ncbi:MAG: DUF86 domain-containing protein [Mycobacterium sp.]
MVDSVRALRLLRGITDDLAVLRREAQAGAVRRSDPIWLRGVKYTFITAIESGLDVAQHICAARGWGPPADNGDAMKLLGSHGVLTAENADAMRKAVGFRNVLVHEYVEVSDEIVLARLEDLRDVDEFVHQVMVFITRD